jgi:WD40 repeat protein
MPAVDYGLAGLIASGSDDRTVRIWYANSGKKVRKLGGHGDSVTSMAFSPDGSRIASWSFDCTVSIWDAKSCKEVRTMPMGSGVSVYALRA